MRDQGRENAHAMHKCNDLFTYLGDAVLKVQTRYTWTLTQVLDTPGSVRKRKKILANKKRKMSNKGDFGYLRIVHIDCNLRCTLQHR